LESKRQELDCARDRPAGAAHPYGVNALDELVGCHEHDDQFGGNGLP
jgi:hypothetical protein